MMLGNIFVLFRRSFNKRTLSNVTRLGFASSSPAINATKSKEEGNEEHAPIKFSASDALKWQAKSTRLGVEKPRLWYESYVILASISVFLIYFTILREENDTDEELTKSLYSRVPGLEEHQLGLCLEYNLEHGKDTSDIVKRLKEIAGTKAQ